MKTMTQLLEETACRYEDRIQELRIEVQELEDKVMDLEYEIESYEEQVSELSDMVTELENQLENHIITPELIISYLESPFVSDYDKNRVKEALTNGKS